MAYVGGAILVVGFVVLIKYLKVIEKSSRVLLIARQSVSIIRDTNNSDLQKEIAMQKYSKELLFLFLVIMAGSALAVIIPTALVWLMDLSGILSFQNVIEVVLSWRFIVSSIIISVFLLWILRIRK